MEEKKPIVYNKDGSIRKKRGRKPKNKIKSVKIKKKRGRKPKKTTNNDLNYSLNSSINKTLFNDNVIIHLPINSKDINTDINFIENKLLTYNPVMSEPTGYTNESFCEYEIEKLNIKQEIDDFKIENTWVKNIPDKILKQNFSIYNMKQKKWPEMTPVYCFWCCHPFNNKPWGVPMKYKENTFTLYGNFCSSECCAKYIFTNNNNNNKWDQYNLLNLFYYKICGKYKQISLAPPKEALKIFGGNLTINQFRKHNTNIISSLIFPPIVPIYSIYESQHISTQKIKLKNKLSNYKDELILKRSKSHFENKNTLDKIMNITIKR
jgi:hypothetical protein